MRKFSIAVLALLMMVVVGAASADQVGSSRIGLNPTVSTYLSGAHAHIVVGPCYLTKITVNSSAAKGYVQVYDSGTTGTYSTMADYISALGAITYDGNNVSGSAGINKRIKADPFVTTAGTTTIFDYSTAPLKFEQGILAGTGVYSSASAPDIGSKYEVSAIIEYTSAN